MHTHTTRSPNPCTLFAWQLTTWKPLDDAANQTVDGMTPIIFAAVQTVRLSLTNAHRNARTHISLRFLRRPDDHGFHGCTATSLCALRVYVCLWVCARVLVCAVCGCVR